MVEKVAASNPATELMRQIMESIGDRKKGEVLNAGKSLHMYVRYEGEKVMRIFSLNEYGQCAITREISININPMLIVSERWP